MPDLVERYWTAEDVRALPEDGKRYECIDGVLLVTPAPKGRHQLAIRALYDGLRDFVRQHDVGVLIWSPADIEIVPGMTVQPDLFVARTSTGSPPREWSDVLGLVLAVEVLSPSTAVVDRGVKRRFYQRAGVAEYWIVDLEARRVERWTPSSTRAAVLESTLVWSPRGVLEPLEIDLSAYFAEVLDD